MKGVLAMKMSVEVVHVSNQLSENINIHNSLPKITNKTVLSIIDEAVMRNNNRILAVSAIKSASDNRKNIS